MAVLAALSCLVPAVSARGAAPPRLLHDLWTIDQGLPENSANSIVQTRDGYLWLGTYEGLVRFDGVRFSVFDRSNTPALASNTVYGLLEDREGSLWIGTNGGGLTRLRDGVFTTFGAQAGMRNPVVRALYEDHAGTLWVGTDHGLYRRHGERFAAYTTAEGLGHDVIRALAEDAEGRLLIGTAGGLDRHEDGRFRHFGTADGLPHEVVRTLLTDRAGRLWIGTGGGLARLDAGRFTSWSSQDGLGSDIVTALHEDRAGTLWIGTNGAGLKTWDGSRIQTPPGEAAIAGSIVYSMLEDQEGSLWVGTYTRGLHRLRRTPFLGFGTGDGLPHELLKGLAEAHDGSLWIATNGGGLARFKDGGFSTLSKRDGLSSDIVITVHEDRAGTLWAGTYLDGLNQIRDGKVRVLRVRDGLANDHITALTDDGAGRLFVGSYGGGVNVVQDGRVTRHYGVRDGLANEVVRSLLVDRRGTLWVGTNQGLFAIRGETATHHDAAVGLATATVVALHEDAAGRLWIGTRGNGLYRRDAAGSIRRCTSHDGLWNDVVYAIVEDGLGNFWMSCDKGVFRVAARELDGFMDGSVSRVSGTAYGRSEGLPSSQCSGGFSPAAARRHDGTLAFPTIAGLAILDPARLNTNQIPPRVTIESVLANGALTTHHEGRMVLPPGAGRLELHYTATSFLVPEKVMFRYQLEGFDPDWIEAGARRVAYYTNLPPGAYAFRVRASNNEGVWSPQGARLELTLSPHYYQTRPFVVACAALALLLLFGGYRLRLRQMNATQHALSALVAERTAKLSEAKDRAEHTLRELSRTNQALREANQLKAELLAIAAHDIKNPLQTVMGCSESIRETAPPGQPLWDKADMIFRNSRRMLDLVSRLVEDAVREPSAPELRRQRIEAAALAESVVAQNRPQAEQKQQPLALVAEAGCWVDADAERLREALDNLVGNAIKYSPAGRPIQVTLACREGWLQIAVRDAGPGLTDDDLRRAFGRFARLSAQPTGGESATGLGLSIVKQIAEAHGGRVSAQSAGSGHGSTFTLELPLARP